MSKRVHISEYITAADNTRVVMLCKTGYAEEYAFDDLDLDDMVTKRILNTLIGGEIPSPEIIDVAAGAANPIELDMAVNYPQFGAYAKVVVLQPLGSNRYQQRGDIQPIRTMPDEETLTLIELDTGSGATTIEDLRIFLFK